MPYSAITTWRRIELPAGSGGPLPEAALRLAVGPGADEVFADTSLVDGREAGRTADGWEAALALVGEGSGAIVLMVDAGLLGAEVCGRLEPLSERLVVAVGVSGYADEAAEPREAAERMSRDPLGTVGFQEVCPVPPRNSSPPADPAFRGSPPSWIGLPGQPDRGPRHGARARRDQQPGFRTGWARTATSALAGLIDLDPLPGDSGCVAPLVSMMQAADSGQGHDLRRAGGPRYDHAPRRRVTARPSPVARSRAGRATPARPPGGRPGSLGPRRRCGAVAAGASRWPPAGGGRGSGTW